MHEESLMRTILSQVRDIAAAHNALAVEEIELEVGPLSNAEPLLLESAFQRRPSESLMSGARIVIRMTELLASCEECGEVSEILNFDFVCCACGAKNVRVVAGDGLRILSVQLQAEPATT